MTIMPPEPIMEPTFIEFVEIPPQIKAGSREYSRTQGPPVCTALNFRPLDSAADVIDDFA